MLSVSDGRLVEVILGLPQMVVILVICSWFRFALSSEAIFLFAQKDEIGDDEWSGGGDGVLRLASCCLQNVK